MQMFVMKFLPMLVLLVSAYTCRAEDKPDVKPPVAKEEPKTSPALTHYMGREIAQTMHYTGAPWLVRESREREEECSTLLKCLNLKAGMVVCDMGCGNGFYTHKISPLVGETGKVLAVDIQPEMLELLNKRAEAAKENNIVTVLGAVDDPKLPEGKVDLVLNQVASVLPTQIAATAATSQKAGI